MRRVGLIIGILAVGLAPLGFLAYGSGPAGPAADSQWPWPYCAPDAEPPGFKPLPYLPSPDGGFFRPIGIAFLRLTDPPVEVGSQQETPRVLASVEAEELKVFRDGMKVEGPVITVSISPELISAVDAALEAGHEVWLGADAARVDGVGSVAFAVDATDGVFLAPEWGPGATTLAADFLKQQGDFFIDHIFGWNSEWFSEEHSGAYSQGWTTFLQAYGIGLDLLQPGTQGYWEAAPEACRSYYDAPPEVAAGLQIRAVTLLVPKSGYPSDAVLCASAASGGMGCTELDANAVPGVVRLDVFDTGEVIRFQLAHIVNGGPSWRERVTVATLDVSDIRREEGPPPVDLVDQLTAPSYAAVAEAASA